MKYACLLLLPLLSIACVAETERQTVRLSAGTETCDAPVELCTLSDPPTCGVYCEDAPPPANDCVEDGLGNVSCGGETCTVLAERDGAEVVACPSDDCAVWFDASTGDTGVTCDAPIDGGTSPSSPGGAPGTPGGSTPGSPGDDGSPDSSPGCSSDTDGDGACDDEPATPAPNPCPDGPDGTPECPIAW